MNTADTPGTVVVGVDGSQAALHAVRWAAVEARSARCPVSLVHILEWPMVSFPVAGLQVDWTQQIHAEGHRWLQQAQETAELAAPGVQPAPRSPSMPPARLSWCMETVMPLARSS
jgi:nucleotide-binding universal stress UspA family protein